MTPLALLASRLLRWALPALLVSLSGLSTAMPFMDEAKILALDAAHCADLKSAHVMGPSAPVSCSQLRIVRFSYVDFSGQVRSDGELMVMGAAAPEVRKIFALLLARRFPLNGARLMNYYQGDDEAAMVAGNTSAFNDRAISGGGAVSLHAFGLAIDVNPVQNPYLSRGDNGIVSISPAAGKPYVKRLPLRSGMVSDEIINIFAEHGFPVWGGDWHQPVDYQHFQVSRKTAEHLATLGIKEGRAYFESGIMRYRRCLVRNQTISTAKKLCALAE